MRIRHAGSAHRRIAVCDGGALVSPARKVWYNIGWLNMQLNCESCADNPWDVGVGDEALHEKVKVKLTVSPTEPD